MRRSNSAVLVVRVLQVFASVALAGPLAYAQSQPITIYPGPSNAAIGSTRQMSAYVPLSPNTVTWAINGVVGGTAAHGTVTQNGLYTAPAVVPADNIITIKVASTADATKFGTAQLTITQPQTNLWSVSPTTVAASNVNFSVNGGGFVPGAYVTLNNQPIATTFVSATKLTVSTTAPAGVTGVVQVRAVNPGPGSTVSTPVNLSVVTSTVTVGVSPTSASVPVTGTRQFTASVSGASNTSVTWSATPGSINSSGVYTAPASLPNPPTAVVKATSVADPMISASVTVQITQPTVTVSVAPQSAAVTLNGTQQFAATVTNAQTPGVTWMVNGVAGGNSTVGTISSAGLYKAPAVLPSPAGVTIRAVSVEASTVYAQAAVTVQLPPPVMPNLSHARFLEQAAFGPSQADLQSVGQLGIPGWLAQQFAMQESAIAMTPAVSDAQQQYLSRLVHAPDQLRQRMINALAKIIVISANKNIYPNELIPYWQILSKNALGSYRQLLWEITVSPQMGKYLDLANSFKPGVSGGTNENYGRELLQLFTAGLVKLNQDGSAQTDGFGKPLPAYDQDTVVQTARALTGWTYPTPPGGNMTGVNWESFSAPAMEAREQLHDTSAKTLIGGCAIPAGRTVAQETNMALDCVFNHPNTAPFVVTRLIRDLVMSNPSGAYVQRVVNVWNDNGTGAKGDLKAVLTAILLDPEARQDQPSPLSGRLKDPIYHLTAFVRAMNGSLTPQNLRPWTFTTMGQTPLGPPTVFGFYAMLYRIPGTFTAGPEFQIYSPTEAVLRGNYIYQMLNQPNQSDLKIDLSPFIAVAADPQALIEQANATLLYGRMPQSMKNSLATALAAAPDNQQRVITALYLTALSGFYTVQY